MIFLLLPNHSPPCPNSFFFFRVDSSSPCSLATLPPPSFLVGSLLSADARALKTSPFFPIVPFHNSVKCPFCPPPPPPSVVFSPLRPLLVNRVLTRPLFVCPFPPEVFQLSTISQILRDFFRSLSPPPVLSGHSSNLVPCPPYSVPPALAVEAVLITWK